MKLFASKRTQRLTNFALAAMLVVSTLTASVPFIFSQKANAAANVIVTPANTQGWITDDTRANGHVSIIADSSEGNGNTGALSMKTDAAPAAGQDKAQYMHYLSSPVALSSVTGALSFDTKQNSALFAAGTPSYQIPVYLNGITGTNFATLVYEPYVDQGNAAVVNGVWQHWDINYTTSKFYSSKTYVGQGGSVVASQGSSTYTLAQIKQFFPNAVVLGYGLNVGSNNPGYDTEADNFTFDGTTYNFETVPLVAPTNLKPVNNSYTNNPSFDNMWNAVPGAVKYEYTASYTLNGNLQTYTDTSDAGNYVLGGSTIVRHNNGAPESTYTWKVRGYDSAGTPGPWSAEQTVTVDTVAPAPTIVTPGVGEKVSGTTPIKVTVNDLHPNYTYMEINQNGVWKAAVTLNGATPTWNFDTTTLADGNYTLKVDAVDQAGNGAEVTRNFKIGNPPVVTGIYPTDGSFIRGITTIGLHTTDSNLSYTYIEFNQNGNWKIDNTSSSSIALGSTGAGNDPKLVLNTANYSDGVYGVKIDSVDTQGNTTEKLLHYTVDNTAPDITVKTGAGDTIGSNGVYKKVSFKLHDNNKVVKYSINGTVINVTPNTYSDANNVTPGDYHGAVAGNNTITVYDVAGNTKTLNFTLDNSATTPTLVSPANGAIVNGASVTQKWSTTDTDIDHYVYESYNDAAMTQPRFSDTYTGTSKTATNVADGSVYYWRVKAVDNLGNESGWSPLWKLTIDSTAPTATLIFPSRGPSATSFQVKFSEQVNPADVTNPANYFLTNWPGAGGSGDLSGHALVDYDVATKTATVHFTTPGWYVSGEQMWGVSGIRDLAGNSIATTHAYSTPLTSPTAPGTPTAVTPTKNSTINWTWDAATDLPAPANDASGIKGYQYQFTNGSTIITPWTDTAAMNATTVAPVDGTYQLHVRALDNAGSPAGPESVGTVVVDQQAPVVALTSPANGATVDGSKKVTVAGSTGDATSYTFEIGQTGKDPVVSTSGTSFTSYTWDTAGIPSGNYIATLTAQDDAGNPATDSRVITVDNTAPVISLAPQITTNGNQPTIVGTVDDANATLVATFNGADYPVTNNNGSFSFTAPTALANGNYPFSIKATDENGNSSTQTANVTVAVAPVTPTNTTGTTSTITPIITSPAAAVLGASTTNNNGAADTGVKGATDDKAAAAINSDLNKGTIFGLAWYWWILILAALALIGWWIAAVVRRRAEEQA